MFQRTHEYRIIKEKLKAIDALEKWAEFECYIDSIATFGFRDNNFYHQFNVICGDDFSRVIMICDLLELKKIIFFSHTLFLERPRKPEKRITEVIWTMYQNSGLN